MEQLLEREAALAVLDDALAAAARGRGRTLLVTGEAGLGKTTLLEHFSARAAPARLFRAGCEALSTPRPLGPLHEVATALGPRVQSLLHGAADRAALFPAVLEALGPPGPPALLVVEDVHWADAATLDLLRFLGRRIHRVPALLVLSCRDDEQSWSAIRGSVADLPPAHLTRVALAPLSVAAVRRLAAGLPVRAERVHEVTGGNPFFVTEVLQPGALEAQVPATVRDAVLGRMAVLPEPSRRLLELAAIVPRQVELTVLAALRAPTPATVDACVASGLVSLERGTLRFRHELARAAIESAIAPMTAATLHREVLQALQAGAAGEPALAQLAHHARLAGDAASVMRWAPSAAAEAAARGARREALEHCRAALDCGGRLEDAARAGLLQEYAFHCFELNRLQPAVDAYQEAIALHVRGGNLAGQVECLSAMAMPLVRSLRNPEADAASRAALQLARGLPAGRVAATAWATEAYLRMLNRDCREAVAAGERAMALASASGDADILTRATETVGAAMFFIDAAQGRALLERSLALARGLKDGGAAMADTYLMLGTASAELHAFGTAELYLEEGIAFARARDLDRVAGYMEAWQALTDLYRGRWDAAGERAAQLLPLEPNGTTSRVMVLLALGRLRTRRGDPAAAEVLDEALALASHSGTLQRLGPVCAARAEAAWLAGDMDGVRREAQRAYALARAKQHAWHGGELGHWLWRSGAWDGDVGGWAEPYALQAQGQWRAAAAAWAAIGCPYEQARCLADGDEDAQRSALALLDGLAARPLAARVRERMRACGFAAVPRGPQPATRANPAGLTRRELEVLQLLAGGLRNAQIAARLSRSVRTVDHHVEALCRKLECASRSDAVQAGRRLGLLDDAAGPAGRRGAPAAHHPPWQEIP